MCDPISLTLASAAVVAGGQITSGIAANQQANYEAKVNTQNAALADEQAHDSITTNRMEAARRYREGGQLEGQQTAAMAANGIDLGFGSAAQVQRDTKMITAEDVGQINKSGFQRTRGYEINAYNFRSGAAAAHAKAGAALISTAFGVASTALGAATQTGKMSNPAAWGK